jgi:hypothetical protein
MSRLMLPAMSPSVWQEPTRTRSGQTALMTAAASRLKPLLVLSSQFVQSSRPQEENTESNSAFAARSMISLSSATGRRSGPVAFSLRHTGDVKVTCSRFGSP